METVIRKKVKDLLKSEPGKDVLAKGWVRTKRGNKNVAFIALNDGSTINNIQIVVDKTPQNEEILAKVRNTFMKVIEDMSREDKIAVIDASRDIDTIASDILTAVRSVL